MYFHIDFVRPGTHAYCVRHDVMNIGKGEIDLDENINATIFMKVRENERSKQKERDKNPGQVDNEKLQDEYSSFSSPEKAISTTVWMSKEQLLKKKTTKKLKRSDQCFYVHKTLTTYRDEPIVQCK